MLFAALLTIFIPSYAYAGAWTQNNGKGLIISNISYYSSSKYFDNSGKKRRTSNYSKYEINPYIEYGVRDWLTVGANLFAQRASQYNSGLGRQQVNWGIGDSELFFRTRLWHDNGFVISAEPMLKLPSMERQASQPQIGNNNYDSGVTLSAGYSFKKFSLMAKVSNLFNTFNYCKILSNFYGHLSRNITRICQNFMRKIRI